MDIRMNELDRVFCQRYKKEMKALPKAPLAGPLGHVLHKHVSAQAYDEWLEMQMKIINEERLDLSDEPSQKRLCQLMISYLGLDDLIDLN